MIIFVIVYLERVGLNLSWFILSTLLIDREKQPIVFIPLLGGKVLAVMKSFKQKKADKTSFQKKVNRVEFGLV